jgi:hypothetical protein
LRRTTGCQLWPAHPNIMRLSQVLELTRSPVSAFGRMFRCLVMIVVRYLAARFFVLGLGYHV